MIVSNSSSILQEWNLARFQGLFVSICLSNMRLPICANHYGLVYTVSIDAAININSCVNEQSTNTFNYFLDDSHASRLW